MSEWTHFKQVISENMVNVSVIIIIRVARVTLSSSEREVIRMRAGDIKSESPYSWFAGDTGGDDYDVSPG